MKLELTVITKIARQRDAWARELGGMFADVDGLEASFGGTLSKPGQLVFVDADHDDLDDVLGKLDRGGRAVFLVTEDAESVPEALMDGRVDDVLVRPFRPVEVLGKLRFYQRLLMWDEVHKLNASFSELVDRFQDDLRLAERLQKGRLPARFTDVKGVRVASRYMAGGKAGGDHFDVAELGGAVSFLVTDTSSYGLSSALLAVVLRVAMRLTADRPGALASTVRKIKDEVGVALGDKDALSVFVGVLSRKDWKLRYLCLGSVGVFHQHASGEVDRIESGGPALRAGGRQPDVNNEGEITVMPGDRLVFLTDGFEEATGGIGGMGATLKKYRQKEATDLLNELAFKVKSGLKDEGDLPEQDCTALVVDVDANVLRLAKS